MSPLRKASIPPTDAENKVRERHNPTPENRLIKRWLAESCVLAGYSHEALARAVGRSKPMVTKWLDPDFPDKVPPAWVILKLPSSVAAHFDARMRGYRDARITSRLSAATLTDCVLQHIADTGAIAEALIEAKREGQLSRKELLDIEQHVAKAESHDRDLRQVVIRELGALEESGLSQTG